MARLKKQQEAIIEALTDGIARAIRVVECGSPNKQRRRSLQEIRHDIGRLDSSVIETIIKQRPIFGLTPNLHESWLVASLVNAREHIKSIVASNVINFRRAGKSTVPIFENHLHAADSELTGSPAGALACIHQCFSKPDNYIPEGIEELTNLTKLVRAVRRKIEIIKSRFLSTILGARMLACLVLIALLSVPLTYYVEVCRCSTASSLIKAGPAVAEQLSIDAEKIHALATTPGESVLKKSASVVEDIWKLIDEIPKIIAAVVAVWGFARRRLAG